MTKAAGFEENARQAVYRAIRERRDVRRGFLREPMPDDLLRKLLQHPSRRLRQLGTLAAVVGGVRLRQ